MKLLLLPLCLLGVAVSIAQDPDPFSDSAKVSASAATVSKRAEVPWSVAGKWQGIHSTLWTDTLTILPDGTFSRTEGSTGRWTLTGFQDHLALVLDWKDWPAETVTMIGPDDFRGKVHGGSFERGDLSELTLHRIQPSPVITSAPKPLVETHRWHQGEPPVRLIRKEEGFCALTMVTGFFRGAREMVKVYVGDDGYWYLGGDSDQDSVAGECIVVRFAGK